MSAAAIGYGSWQLLCSGTGIFSVCCHLHIFNSLGPEAYSRNERISGTLKLGCEVIL